MAGQPVISTPEQGVEITFSNGWTVSIAWKLQTNYADPNGLTVELAVLRGEHVRGGVQGWTRTDDIPAFLADVAARCHCGADFKGSDHCPACGCEVHEQACNRIAIGSFI